MTLIQQQPQYTDNAGQPPSEEGYWEKPPCANYCISLALDPRYMNSPSGVYSHYPSLSLLDRLRNSVAATVSSQSPNELLVSPMKVLTWLHAR